jgi:hypothetical protein
MNETSTDTADSRPPRHEPPSGIKVYGALFGIGLMAFVGCVLFTVVYMYFLEIRSLR